MTTFTVANVLRWARTKPADEEYPYYNCKECALAQYSAAVGLPIFNEQRSDAEEYRNLGKHLIATPWTFGALAERLEALLPAKPISTTWTQADAYLEGIEPIRMTTTHSLEG